MAKRKNPQVPEVVRRDGDLCAVFANTASPKRRSFSTYPELLAWAVRVGAVTAADGERLGRASAVNPEEAAEVFDEVLEARSLIRRILHVAKVTVLLTIWDLHVAKVTIPLTTWDPQVVTVTFQPASAACSTSFGSFPGPKGVFGLDFLQDGRGLFPGFQVAGENGPAKRLAPIPALRNAWHLFGSGASAAPVLAKRPPSETPGTFFQSLRGYGNRRSATYRAARKSAPRLTGMGRTPAPDGPEWFAGTTTSVFAGSSSRPAGST